MTNQQALESMTEYRNDNLFEKLLTEQGLTASDAYSSANAQAVDMALADVLFALATQPKLTEGKLSIEYSPKSCIRQRRALYAKYGGQPPEDVNGVGVPKITARPFGSGPTARRPW